MSDALSAAPLLSRGRSCTHTYAGVITFLILIGLPTILLSELSDRTATPVELMLPFAGVTVFAAARLAIFAATPTNLLSAIFYLFVYIWVGVAPLLQLVAGHGPLSYGINLVAVPQTAGVIVAGIAAFEMVGLLAQQRVPDSRHRDWCLPFLPAITAASAILAMVLILMLGGPGALLSSRQGLNTAVYGGTSDKSLGAIFFSLLIVPPFATFITAITSHRHPRTSPVAHRLCLSTLLLLNVIINNPVGQGRFWFTTVWGSIIVAVLVRRRVSLTWLPVVVVLAALYIFPNADVFRYTNSSMSGFHFSPPTEQLVNKGDFDSFQQMTAAIQYVSAEGLRMGQQFLSSMLFFVPRSLWPAKAIDTGSMLARYVGFPNTNLSAPLWVEGYVDGGYVGTLVLFAFMGLIHARLNQSPLAVGAIVFAFYQLVLLRGSLLASMSSGAVLLIVMAVLAKMQQETAQLS